jgi:AcrR family transcriptional regulator
MMDHISVAAWALFEARGLDAVSMESTALAADVATGTLYKQFPVKESLIGYLFDSDRSAQAARINAAVIAKSTCSERLAHRLQIDARYIETMRRYVAP